MDDSNIEKTLKIMEFLKTFDPEINALIDKLIKRYKDKPTEDADIVFSTVATLCGRIISKTIPYEIWEHILVVLAEGLMKAKNKNNNQTKH